MIIELCDRCGEEVKDGEARTLGDPYTFLQMSPDPTFRASLCLACFDKVAEFASPRLFERFKTAQAKALEEKKAKEEARARIIEGKKRKEDSWF